MILLQKYKSRLISIIRSFQETLKPSTRTSTYATERCKQLSKVKFKLK